MKIPAFRQTVGGTTPEVLASDVSDWAEVLAATLNGKLDLPGVDEVGNVSKGNIAATISTNTFRESDQDVFFTHDLGVPTKLVIPLAPSNACQIYLSPKPPSENGVYLRCKMDSTVSSVKASVLVWGRRAR